MDVVVVRKFAFGEFVHIQPVGAAQQVVDGLVILLLHAADVQTGVQFDMVVERVGEVGASAQLEVVEDAVLDHVLGAFALLGGQLVDFIHLVPVDLGV